MLDELLPLMNALDDATERLAEYLAVHPRTDASTIEEARALTTAWLAVRAVRVAKWWYWAWRVDT